MKKFIVCIFLFFLFIPFLLESQSQKAAREKSALKPSETIQFSKIDINNLEMWFTNDGLGPYNKDVPNSGFFWPKGSGKVCGYTDGPLIAGKINDSLRIVGSNYSTSFLRGPVINGIPSDTNDQYSSIFKIRKDWQNLPEGDDKIRYEYGYNHWPIEIGAPFEIDNSGRKRPRFIGDQQAFFVMNDFNRNKTLSFTGTEPIGLEVQCLIWAYAKEKYLDNVIFKKYTLINKNENDLKEAYLCYWGDIDIGDRGDDFSGCDTAYNIGYMYNYPKSDAVYGIASPAVGYLILQGPTIKTGNVKDKANWNFGEKAGYINLKMTSFNWTENGCCLDFLEPEWKTSRGITRAYNYMKGLKYDGTSWINPLTQAPSKFYFSGDPVTKRGWIDGPTGNPPFPPGDKKIWVSSGPFEIAKKDTQEFVVGIIVGNGVDSYTSITVMKYYSLYAYSSFNFGMMSPDKVSETPEPIFSLSQNYPNPFNGTTLIKFNILKAGFTNLIIYDLMGKEITKLISKNLTPGEYKVTWDALNYPSGTYFYKLSAGKYSETKKLVLVK